MLPMLQKAKADYEQLVALVDELSLEEDYSKPPTTSKTVLLDCNRNARAILQCLQNNPFWGAPLSPVTLKHTASRV